MVDLIAAFGLVLVLEGLIFAAAPGHVREAMRQAAETAPERLRLIGLICAVIGVALVWLARRVF